MSHYEERLERDLKTIRGRVAEVGGQVDVAVRNGVNALLRLDRNLAAQTILGDHPINRATREIDRLCHAFVARHLPSAGILRYVSSVLRLTVVLERIGDYGVTIARESVQLTQPAPEGVARDIEMLCDQSLRMLRSAMQAFEEGSADRARGTKSMADQSGTVSAKVFHDLLREGEAGTRPVKDLFALLLVLNRLDRVSDLAKNICEEAIFVATGETKQPKVYRVLFLDEHNAFRSVMAEAIARKGYPDGGEYESAGWEPAAAVDSAVLAFLDARGHDLHDRKPRKLQPSLESLNEYHVVVSLAGDPTPHMEGVPYHTVVATWDVGEGGKTDEEMESLYHDLSTRIRDLMETLRGSRA
jgi:phosphate transport system protein